MESITIKMEEGLAAEMEVAMNPYYSTKTEFIREAIRDKIKMMKKDAIYEEFKKNFGKSKIKTTYADDRRIREEVSKKWLKELE